MEDNLNYIIRNTPEQKEEKKETTMDSRITELHELIHDLEDFKNSEKYMIDDIVDRIQIIINKIKDEQRKVRRII
tara:strand:- start:1232 stop:1456 length:225 start_codon:yes stop_codon:yes gene_type:complete